MAVLPIALSVVLLLEVENIRTSTQRSRTQIAEVGYEIVKAEVELFKRN